MADFEERIAELEAELDRTYRGMEFLKGELRKQPEPKLPAEGGAVMRRERFRERLEVEVQRSQRHDIPLTLLVIELDPRPSLESPPDSDQPAALFEHACSLVRENCRRTDLVGRGREGEIVAGLFATSPNGARILAARLLRIFEESPFPSSEGAPVSISCSIGIAALDAEARSLPLLLESARGSLRKAQEKGGGQFHVSGELPLLKRLWRTVVEFLKDPPRRRSEV